MDSRPISRSIDSHHNSSPPPFPSLEMQSVYTHRCPSTVALRGGSVFSAAKLRVLAPRRARPAARGGLIAIQAAQQEQLQLVLVGFTLIIDDIVDHTGRTYMAELGGGGPQTLFGFQLSSMAVGEFAAPRFASNSLLDHGATPVLLQSWTCKVGHDGVRVFTNPRLALCNKLPPTHLLAVVCDPYLTNAGGGGTLQHTTIAAPIGLAAGVGPDLPASCVQHLEEMGVDTTGLLLHQHSTPRAWQVRFPSALLPRYFPLLRPCAVSKLPSCSTLPHSCLKKTG